MSPYPEPRRGGTSGCSGWLFACCGLGVGLTAGLVVIALALYVFAPDGSLPGLPTPARSVPPTASGEPPYADDPAWNRLRDSPITTFTVPEFPSGSCDPGEGLRDPSSDPTRHEQYLKSLATCLDALWKPIIEQAGLTFVPITVRVGDPESAAGACQAPQEPTAAYYCPEDHSVTFSPTEDFGAGEDEQRYVHTHYLWVLDHEYAHHVQAMTGMFDDLSRLESAGPNGGRWDISRRIELQAACIGEATLAQGTGDFALTRSQRRHQSQLEAYTADDAHGSAESQLLWSTRGLNSGGRIAVCDTFSAQPADVD